jgi:hypothetical protein
MQAPWGLTFGLFFALPIRHLLQLGLAVEYEIFFGVTGALIFGGVNLHGTLRGNGCSWHYWVGPRSDSSDSWTRRPIT